MMNNSAADKRTGNEKTPINAETKNAKTVKESPDIVQPSFLRYSTEHIK